MESLSAPNIWQGTISSSQEELYQRLEYPEGSTQPFAMLVHLTPEIVRELRHAEANGITPRMKFGNNVGGHVIEVGLETFIFSLAPEPGDVCYIYAEQSDASGKHILKEVGLAWHKLSVQHTLNFSEKEQSTAEAANKQKLQKSVSVCQNAQLSNPQIALAEVDSKEAVVGLVKDHPFRKRKITHCPVPLAHEQFYFTEQFGNQHIPAHSSLSPKLMGAAVKEALETPLVALSRWKDKPPNGEPAFQPLSKARSAEKERAITTATSIGSDVYVLNIRNLLIDLLQETPKGMTIKALEKAITEKLLVNPERKWIEKIIKSIASFHAPGKYILNPGVEKGTVVDSSIGISGKSSETSFIETVETKPFTNSSLSALSWKELNPDLPKSSHNQSYDSCANEHFSPQLVHSHITNEFDGISPRTGAMEEMAITSRGSHSSSTDESGSESGTSSTTSSSESSSSSESDVSTSSSEPNMDEDVDIMSDGDDKMTSNLSHQRLKGEELTLLAKQASKLEDEFENTEEIDSETLEKHKASLDIQSKSTFKDAEVKDRECIADSPLETVFGPDKGANVTLDSPVPLKHDNSRNSLNSLTLRNEAECGVSSFSQMPSNTLIDNSFSETPESCQEGCGNQEQRKRTGSERSSSLGQMEARATKRVKQLDILVDKICEDKDALSTSSPCVQVDAHQTSYQNPSCKASEMVGKKEADRQSIKQEMRPPIKKARIDNLLSKTSSASLEVNKKAFVGSSSKEKHMAQKVGRPLMEANNGDKSQSKQHSSMKPDKLITTNERKKLCETDMHDASQPGILRCNERAAPDIVSLSGGPGDNSKSARSLHNSSKESAGRGESGCSKEGIGKSHMRKVTNSQKDDLSDSKEELSKTSMHKLTNSGETLPRQGKYLKAGQCPGTNKPTATSITRESGNAHDVPELEQINKDTQKACECNSLECAERTSSFEEQVESPKKDADLSKQGRQSKIEEDLKETGLKVRPLNDGMLSRIASREGRIMETAKMDSARSSRSGHDFSRSSFHESTRYDSQDLELGEFREPLSESEFSESKRLSSRREKHCFEATSRVTSDSKSVSPDSKRLLLLSRSGLEASPAEGESNLLQDLGSQEIITQDAQRAVPYRPLKKNQGAGQYQPKLGADRAKKSQRERSISINKDLRESARSGSSDLQNCTAGSKETSRKYTNKLLGDLNPSSFSQQKPSNAARIPKKKKLKENHRVKDLQRGRKKETPRSSEVHGAEFFVLYEKEEPELRGAICSFEQFRDYYQEFNEKYPIYTQLNASLENDKENFETFRKEFEEAEQRDDMAKLALIHGLVRKKYFQCRKRSKRMRHTFKILHEELQVIKQHCKEYAQRSRSQ